MRFSKKVLLGLAWAPTFLATASAWARLPSPTDWTLPELNQVDLMTRVPQPPCDEIAAPPAPAAQAQANPPAPTAPPPHIFSSLWEKLPSRAQPSEARLTFYFPAHAKSELAMEGGIVGQNNRRIYTLDDFLRDPEHVPYVSVAADTRAYGKPGQLLRIRVLEDAFEDQMKAKGIDWIPFCVMDTGSAFRGDGRRHFDVSLDQTPDHYPALNKINVNSARYKVVPVGWRMPYEKMPYLTNTQIARWVAALPGGRSSHSRHRRHHSAKKS